MRIFVVDAFTDRAFRGNPAGVCLVEEEVDPAWMQSVAAEMRHSETAFVRRLGDPAAPPEGFSLRWFTPETEVRLCGHATLAAARALYAEGMAEPGESIEFHTLSGLLTVRQSGDGLALDFPVMPAEFLPEAPSGLSAALGAEPVEVGRNAQNDLLVLLPDAATVRALDPELALLSEIDARGVCVTAPGEEDSGADFVSRFFAPSVGVPEDPVTGSAHCMLAPYWAHRLGRARLTGLQVSARSGRVGVALADGRVTLTGQAVIVLIGELLV